MRISKEKLANVIEEKVNSKFRQIRNFTHYAGVSDADLLEKAKEFVYLEQEFNVADRFEDKKEKKLSKTILDKYLNDFTLDNISDRNTLKELIYYEVVQTRLQTKLNDIQKSDNAVPTQLLDTLHSNSELILKLKANLGLTKPKQGKETDFTVLEKLKKRFAQWREDNQGSRTLTCPHCGKMVLLKIRTAQWEAQKHPFFKDRLLGNKRLIELYQSNKLTREDVAQILEVSTDYIDWLIEKWNKNAQNANVEVPQV